MIRIRKPSAAFRFRIPFPCGCFRVRKCAVREDEKCLLAGSFPGGRSRTRTWDLFLIRRADRATLSRACPRRTVAAGGSPPCCRAWHDLAAGGGFHGVSVADPEKPVATRLAAGRSEAAIPLGATRWRDRDDCVEPPRVALGDNALALLSALHPSGKAANAGTLRRKLGWADDEFEAAAGELCEAGLADAAGKRLARVVSNSAVSPEAQMLLAALPADGASVGGLRLRSSLDLDNDTYTRVKRELDAAGLITLGRGRGGTVARAEVIPNQRSARSDRSERRLAAKESDLYAPFAEWLQADLAVQPGFAHAKITGSAKGWAHGTGKWSRPDVTAVEVTTHEWLPEVTVEVRS